MVNDPPVITLRRTTVVRVGIVVAVMAALGVGLAIGLTVGSNSPPPPNKSAIATTTTTMARRTASTTTVAPTTTTTVVPTTTTTLLPTVLSCGPGSPSEVRPALIFIGCATGNPTVSAMSWSTWGPSGGQGTGTFNENDCQPDCAQGSFTSVPATVVVSDPAGGVFQDVSVTPTSGALSPVSADQPGSGWGTG